MTSTAWPKGLVTALVTPLADDAVDGAAFAELIEDQIANGAAGLVVTGGTGEYNTLTLDERAGLFERAVAIADGRVPIVAATGCLATRDSIALALRAERADVDGLLVASAYGEGINWRERLAFYGELDAAVSTPVMIYNTPPAGLLGFDQIRTLAELPNVTAVKDSSGDPELMGDLAAWSRTNGFGVYVGKDSFLYEAIAGGATGAVFGAANIIPGELARLIALLQEQGGGERALALWSRIRPLLRLMERSPNYVALCKAGCRLRGIDVGEVRKPWLMPDPDEIALLARALDAMRAEPVPA